MFARMHANILRSGLFCAAMSSIDAPDRRAKPRVRRTQQERSETTRRLLLDATIECLVEEGYAKTTMARICARAGVSRGAHLHHFGTRSGLINGALERYGERLVANVMHSVALLPESPEPEQSLDLLWEVFSSGLFQAAIDLWAVARTDPQLRESLLPAEQALNRHTMQLCRTLFPDHAQRADFEALMNLLLSTVRGLALLDVVHPSRARSAERWTAARGLLLQVLASPGPGRQEDGRT